MRIAILAQTYLFDKTASINGTLVQLHNLAQGFVKKGIEVHYIATTKDRSKKSYKLENGIHFHWIQSQNGFFEWRRTVKLYKNILNTISPDAVYVRGRNVLQYVAGNYAKEQKINFVWGTNGEDSAELWKNLKRLKKSNKSLLKQIALFPLKAWEDYFINQGMKMADIVINQTKHQQSETRKILNKSGVVLPNYFHETNANGIKKNQILWLATLSPNKQPEKFIELFNKPIHNNWGIILGGGSKIISYQTRISHKATDYGITCVGSVAFKNSFNYYQNAKIYVNTSQPDSDGLPNAYIQSWLAGTVVLSLHHDPNNWFDKHNIGYCSNGDMQQLRGKIDFLIENPKELQTMSENARLFANKTFANPEIIESYKNMFYEN